MKELPLKALRVFESVSRCGSFKAAAEELCVSQSAVSHQIKHLETWLGRPLFDRTGHRPQLLAHAHMLSAALKRSLQDIDAACQAARCTDSSRALVIASIPSVAICWLIPRLSAFQIKHPDIAIRVVYAFHGQNIDFNQVDLAFVFANTPPELSGYRTQFFQPGASVAVCSPALYDTLNLTALTESVLKAGLLHDSDISGWTNWLSQAELDPMPQVVGPLFEDFNLLRAAALAGQGVALCPLALIGTDLATNALIQLSNIAINQSSNYYLINRDANNVDTEVARNCFAEWIADMLVEEESN